jgi:hypothetical protein
MRGHKLDLEIEGMIRLCRRWSDNYERLIVTIEREGGISTKKGWTSHLETNLAGGLVFLLLLLGSRLVGSHGSVWIRYRFCCCGGGVDGKVLLWLVFVWIAPKRRGFVLVLQDGRQKGIKGREHDCLYGSPVGQKRAGVDGKTVCINGSQGYLALGL